MQKIELSILPQGKLNPIVRCSQGDVGRQFQVELYNEDMSAKYVLDGTETLTVEGHKPDGNFFSFDLPATTGSVITVTTTEQMTACYGDVYGEIRIEKGSILLGTANFTLAVEIGASAEDTVSISALQFIDALRNEMHQAVDDAEDYADDSKAWAVGPNGSGTGTDTNNSKYYSEQSANSATNSANSADDSKAWAVGPSGSGSGTDSNNSKYYSQQSASSASSASSSASDAKNWAVGPSGSGSGTDSNNAKHYSQQSAQSATDASGYATNASNSANAASGSANDAKNWAVGPSGTGTGTDSNNAKYYAQQSSQSATDADTAKDDAVTAKNDAVQAKNDAVSAKNGAEAAQQKIENMTASASGLPAGSSPTVTKTEVGGVVNLGFGIPKGDKGDKGDTGNDGVSPTASVTQTDPDTVTFTVTDGQGTTTATLSAGGAPALAGLSDVNLTTPSDKQALVYDGNTSKWVNGQAGVPEPYPYGERTLTAGKISGYNSSSERIIENFNPVNDIRATDNILWFIGMPIVFVIDNNNDNIHYRCELVDYRVTLHIGNDSYDTNNPAYCMHHIAETVASGEEGLAYDFELYFLIPDNTSRLVKVAISYDSYGNMTSHTTTYVSIASSGGSTDIIADEFDTTATTTPKTYPEYSVVSYNGNGYFNGTTPTSATPPASPWVALTKDAVPSYGGTVAFEHCAEDSNGDLWQNTDKYTQTAQWFNPSSPDTKFFTKLGAWVANETTYHSYYVGDYVIYNDVLYKCVVDTTGQAWDSNAWSATQVCDELSSGGGGGANETYIDWSQENSYRWRVSRFWDTASVTGVEIEINTAQLGVWSDYDVVFGNSLVSDYDNRKYQLIKIDVPLSSLVHPDANGNITAIVEGNTYTFNLSSAISSYDNYPFLVQFCPPALFGSLPNPSFLQKSAGVEGTTAYLTVTADGPAIMLSFYLRTDTLINSFSDLMSALGMSSWGGIFGPICGSVVLSKSKS